MRLAGNGQRSRRGSGPGARRPITADLVRSRLVAERAIKAQTTIHALYLGSFANEWLSCDDAASSLARIGRSARKLQYRRSRPRCSARALRAAGQSDVTRDRGNLAAVAAIQAATEVRWAMLPGSRTALTESMAVAIAISCSVEQQAMMMRGIGQHPEGGGHRYRAGIDRNRVRSGCPGGRDCGWARSAVGSCGSGPVPRTSRASSRQVLQPLGGGFWICATSLSPHS